MFTHSRLKRYGPLIENKAASRIRVDARIGKENIFLLFKFFKELRYKVVDYEENYKKSIVIKLKIYFLPVCFWNCDQSYLIKFDLISLKGNSTVLSEKLELVFPFKLYRSLEI